MPGLKSLIAILACAAGLALAPVAGAAPVGPCEDVPYVGQRVPVGETPTPRVQQNHADVAVAPDGSIGSIN